MTLKQEFSEFTSVQITLTNSREKAKDVEYSKLFWNHLIMGLCPASQTTDVHCRLNIMVIQQQLPDSFDSGNPNFCSKKL